jgi:hypothetical protein
MGIGEKESLGLTFTAFQKLEEDGIEVAVDRGFNHESVQQSLKQDDPAYNFLSLALFARVSHGTEERQTSRLLPVTRRFE